MTRFATFILAGALALALGAAPAPSHAQSSSQIENALKPKGVDGKPLTRSLNRQPASVDPKTSAVITRSLNRTRAILVEPATKEELKEIAEVIKDKPKIDLAIFFDYNSDVIGPKAKDAVDQLGSALLQPSLKGAVIQLNGHTDAAGSDDYNLALSHRRAQSVRRYLIEVHRVEPQRLLVAGFGFTELKNKGQPLAPENRRVEVVNMAEQQAAKPR